MSPSEEILNRSLFHPRPAPGLPTPPGMLGLVLDSAFSRGPSLFRRLGAGAVNPRDIPGYRDNLDLMKENPYPCLLLHGMQDDLIPPGNARELLVTCSHANKTLIEFPDAGHNNLLVSDPRRYQSALTTFFAR